jgi:hypothetical protein
MSEEYKKATEKLKEDDYASAYEACEDLRKDLVNSICFNDIEEFRKILQYLNEIKNRTNEKVKNPKKDKENERSLVRKMKKDFLKMGEKELQKFFEELIRTSYYLGAVSGVVNSLCDVGSQFEEKSFVPHGTSIDDLLYLMSSSKSRGFMQAIRERKFIEHVVDTGPFITELKDRHLIKLDENKVAFLTNKGYDLLEYHKIQQNIEYLETGPSEIDEFELNVGDMKRLRYNQPSNLPLIVYHSKP